jgi:hypothetical protein
MYITDGYRPACDTGHTCHLEFNAYACLTSSRMQNRAFSAAHGFFTHCDMAWSALIRWSTTMSCQRTVLVVWEMTEHTRSVTVGVFAVR